MGIKSEMLPAGTTKKVRANSYILVFLEENSEGSLIM